MNLNTTTMVHDVEQAELKSGRAAQDGLAKLREEVYHLIPSSDRKDVIGQIVDKLDHDGALDAIADAWAREALQPGELLSSEMKIYDDAFFAKQKRSLNIDSDLDRQLAAKFISGLTRQHFDTTAVHTSGLFGWKMAISANNLDSRIVSDNRSIENQRLIEGLKVEGPEGPVWKSLLHTAESGKIRIDTLDLALTQGLSADQKQAIEALKADWNGAFINSFKKDTKIVYYPMDQVASTYDPYYDINATNRMNPFNYRKVTVSTDYLNENAIKSMLARKFNGQY